MNKDNELRIEAVRFALVIPPVKCSTIPINDDGYKEVVRALDVDRLISDAERIYSFLSSGGAG